MKKKLTLLLLICAVSNALTAQKNVYDSNHDKKDFETEQIALDLKPSTIGPKQSQIATAVAAAIPLALDFGFKTTTKMLENRKKKFSAEYSKYNSYLDLTEFAPVIKFIRYVTVEGKKVADTALVIELEPKKVSGTLLENYIYYELSQLKLNYSAAKSTKKFPDFDYTIELKLDCIIEKERKSLDLKPIVISSIEYEKKGEGRSKRKREAKRKSP